MKKSSAIFIAFWLLLGFSSFVFLTLKKRNPATSLENGKLAKQWEYPFKLLAAQILRLIQAIQKVKESANDRSIK